MNLVNIYSTQDSDYDFEVIVPEGMSNHAAVEKIKAVIEAAIEGGFSEDDPSYTEEISSALDDAGFVTPSWAGKVCMETGDGQAYGEWDIIND